ncbi:MAG: nucleotidyltransferase domain-containing protein [Chloroflexota bacterium]|nr:nucleotidyltransferase domain-containing protein [Chloroflexota bacterium]
MEDSKAKALASAHTCAELLKSHFGARRVIIFGSLAGQGPWHDRSDIDLAVEGLAPADYFRALSTCWELLPQGINLDLVTLEDARPELRARILGEMTMPSEPHEPLRQEIQLELDNLARIAGSTRAFLARLSAQPDEYEIRSIGSLLHDFYSGVERIFERIAVRLDGDLPAGSSWHTYLLQRMTAPWAEVRPVVIDQELATRLQDYLRFRHLFRHTYGFDLQWEKCQGLAEGMMETLETLRTQVMAFLRSLA